MKFRMSAQNICSTVCSNYTPYIFVLPTFLSSQQFCSPNLFFCSQHFWAPNIFVLSTFLNSQHFCTPTIFVLPTILYSQHFWTPNTFVLPKYFYYISTAFARLSAYIHLLQTHRQNLGLVTCGLRRLVTHTDVCSLCATRNRMRTTFAPPIFHTYEKYLWT